jgi:hypothetical protein
MYLWAGVRSKISILKGQIQARDTLCEVLSYIYCVDNNHQLNTVFTLYVPLLSNLLFERM